MRTFFLASLTLVAGISYLGVYLAVYAMSASREQAASTKSPTTADANRLLQGQPGFFVPNLGQWDRGAKFVRRSGPMTLFLQDRGWILDLVERPVKPRAKPHELAYSDVHRGMPGDCKADQKTRGVAMRMTFEGDAYFPEIVGEKKLSGHHNYFLGNDESKWRTNVPLYGSVRYENLYPGIDLRLREANGVPEYDLLLQPGADLSRVIVRVEGGQGLSIAKDGSLIIETALRPLIQPAPKTWEVGSDSRRREVACNFTLLGLDRFGFVAPGWDGDTGLTIDPGLIWSTYLGGNETERAYAIAVDSHGLVTVTGHTWSGNFPASNGAYNTTINGSGPPYHADVFVSRFDPSKAGTAQLVCSTFLGGTRHEYAKALSVDASGVVTVAGDTGSRDFPTTIGAFDRTFNGGTSFGGDAFVSRLDPSKVGAAQLVWSTFVGGQLDDRSYALAVDDSGVVTVAGNTDSTDFPTPSGAHDPSFNGVVDAFVSRLDPRKSGNAQLVYSTFVGGKDRDEVNALCVDTRGVVGLAGTTWSTDFPTAGRAYDPTFNGGKDAFVSRLDPSKTSNAQLVHSTFLGGSLDDEVNGLSVDSAGVVTLAGITTSTDFPTTSRAYDRTYNSIRYQGDAFVSRLDPRHAGNAQLVYSTYLGGDKWDWANAISVDSGGVVTVAGATFSANFPTTIAAYDTTHNGGSRDPFVSRLDPNKNGGDQLVYSTFLGLTSSNGASALAVDASGVVTVTGDTASPTFPTTSGAYDTAFNGGIGKYDGFVSRLDMGVSLYGDVHELSIATGGTQQLTVNAGKVHANRLYWIFGSVTGTRPGVNLLGVHIPLNPDLYTDVAMATVNTTVFTKFRGALDSNGLASASFNVPANLPVGSGFTFHHAYVMYDANGNFHMASNAVPLRLK